MNATFYCDESGSTGTNWLDFDQPFFVYGGWLIPDENRDAILSGLNDIFEKYPGAEIKSKRFFKMGKADEYFKRLFELMLRMPAFPVFTITDKVYIVAPKIIETFFDPTYNQALNNQFGWDMGLKKQLVEVIRKNDVIVDFAKLIRAGTLAIDEIQNIKAVLAKGFREMPSVSNNINGITDNELLEMLDEFNQPNSARSLTIPSLNHLMQVLEKFSESCGMKTEIVHDNIRGYDDWLEMMREIYFSDGEVQILQTEHFQWYSKLPHITALNLVDSKDERLIQVADLLCGFLLRCFQKVDRDVELTSIEKELMRYLFVLHDEMHTWDYVFPDELIVKYLNAIDLNVPKPNPIDCKQINDNFAKYLKS